jgi:putative transposase
MARFRLIQPYLEERRSLQSVAADAKLPFRTAQRCVIQYRQLKTIVIPFSSQED